MLIQHAKKLLVLFLAILLLFDFFIAGNIDLVCRAHQGYGFGYATSESAQRLNQIHYGQGRIGYNFAHFFIFWAKPAYGKTYHNLVDFLTLDGNPLRENIFHFFAFLIFALLLFYVFRLNILSVILIGLFFNVFHEYIAEGICVDPSFNDLWVDLIGILFGILFVILWPNLVKRKFFS